MIILLIVYFLIGALFIYASTLSDKKMNFQFYLKTLMITIAWPLVTLIYFLRLPFNKEMQKGFNDIFNRR